LGDRPRGSPEGGHRQLAEEIPTGFTLLLYVLLPLASPWIATLRRQMSLAPDLFPVKMPFPRRLCGEPEQLMNDGAGEPAVLFKIHS
jgi:hypothetical protein